MNSDPCDWGEDAFVPLLRPVFMGPGLRRDDSEGFQPTRIPARIALRAAGKAVNVPLVRLFGEGEAFSAANSMR
jgi:hypothetical protein